MLKPIPLPLGALVSKSAEIEARVLLPEGPKGEGHFQNRFPE